METKIKEEIVKVKLSYASRARYNEKGYNFPLEYVTKHVEVEVKVKDLRNKSNAMITRICGKCEKEDYMTYHKARFNPLCHKCVTNTDEFRKNVGLATQKARLLKGSKVSARRKYLLEVGDIPDKYSIHHIDMDDSHNELSNFIALSNSQHHITHGTFNRLCRDLMEARYVEFDPETLTYKLGPNFKK